MAFPAPGLLAVLIFAVLPSFPATDISEPFHCKRLFAGTGVRFARDSSGLFVLPEQDRPITQQEAETADSIMLATSGNGSFEQTRRQYYRYDRQYLGYWGSAGQKLVFINLVEKSKAKRSVANYQHALTCNLIMVFTGPGQEFLIRKKVDMEREKASDY